MFLCNLCVGLSLCLWGAQFMASSPVKWISRGFREKENTVGKNALGKRAYCWKNGPNCVFLYIECKFGSFHAPNSNFFLCWGHGSTPGCSSGFPRLFCKCFMSNYLMIHCLVRKKVEVKKIKKQICVFV